jgi:hypothetical protein
MKRKTVSMSIVALWLLVQSVVIPGASAGEPSLAADVSAGAISVIATVIAAPLKLAGCVATVALGGIAYGFTMGTSELIREELVAGTKSTCGGKYYITQQEVRHIAREPEQQR